MMSLKDGYTAVDYADIADNGYIVKWLLDSGARPSGNILPKARGESAEARRTSSMWVGKEGGLWRNNNTRPMERELWRR